MIDVIYRDDALACLPAGMSRRGADLAENRESAVSGLDDAFIQRSRDSRTSPRRNWNCKRSYIEHQDSPNINGCGSSMKLIAAASLDALNIH
jgi:hypothetical protein